MERDKRERFVELGEARVRKATQMLRLIGNLSNPSNYEVHAGGRAEDPLGT